MRGVEDTRPGATLACLDLKCEGGSGWHEG
jgi:hypothetical protein